MIGNIVLCVSLYMWWIFVFHIQCILLIILFIMKLNQIDILIFILFGCVFNVLV
ncbi:MAG: hypothetical protein DMNBKLKJ_00021 [Candidatus Westeberhardia cardiocondylae]|nr:hypothetical protein [Candidatus Westeberhardia cardiocondylae]